MTDELKDIGEFGLIERLCSLGKTEGAGVVLGVGDDCAALDDGAAELLLLTCDLMAEESHFRLSADPEWLGYKLMAVNLSDIAAMGGAPRHAVVSLAVPGDMELEYLDGIYRGLFRCAGQYTVSIVGGDTSTSRSGLVLSLTLTGRVAREQMLTRDGARPGDRILVSGTLGDAGGGLTLLKGGDASHTGIFMPQECATHLLSRLHRPEPRLELGRALAKAGGVTAAIDLSDGLASDLVHICRRSQVGAMVDLERIPLSDLLCRGSHAIGVDPLDLATGAGEDYELCLTADPAAVDDLLAVGDDVGVPLAEVGEITEIEEPLIRWHRAGGAPVDPLAAGWDHFK